MNKPLRFNIELGRTKPVNIRDEQVRCPFCDRSKLTDILDTSGHIIWLMNKYPVLEKTWPTVIIETETDEGEFSTLPADEAAYILQFGLDKWRETRQRKEFKSVLFFKTWLYVWRLHSPSTQPNHRSRKLRLSQGYYGSKHGRLALTRGSACTHYLVYSSHNWVL